MSHLTVFRTAERPDLEMWLLDADEALVDLSSGYTFVFKIGVAGMAATFTKSTNITGAAGSGTEPTGTPNVTLTFTAAELDSLTIGTYDWQLRATTGGLDRIWTGKVTVRDVIT
jgi:hypothetical protein